jgi:hypothetical protein
VAQRAIVGEMISAVISVIVNGIIVEAAVAVNTMTAMNLRILEVDVVMVVVV